MLQRIRMLLSRLFRGDHSTGADDISRLTDRCPDGVWVEEGSSAHSKLADRGYTTHMKYIPRPGEKTMHLMRNG